MKIFPPQAQDRSSRPEKVKTSKNGVSRKKLPPPERKDISASEIKGKLAAHTESSAIAKPKTPLLNSQKLGEGFLNDAVVRPPIVAPLESEVTPEAIKAKKDHLLKSDIAQNDPSDTNTQEKLKTVLSKGAFNFNPKEKELLEKILA